MTPQRAIAPALPMKFDRELTPRDRAKFYNDAHPDYPAVYESRGWLCGMWMIGQNYAGSGYYGSYPPHFVDRVTSMFPDANDPKRVMHLFSGSVRPGPYIRVDCRANPCDGVTPDVVCNAEDLAPFSDASYDLILADPPYSCSDALRYGVPMCDRQKVLAACCRVLRLGGNLAWLDQILPMYRKTELRMWGTIGVVRSTNHRFRCCSLWERR